MKKSGVKSAMSKTKGPVGAADEGLVITDPAFNLIAFDPGAAIILNYREHAVGKTKSVSDIPEELLQLIRNRNLNDRSVTKTNMRLGRNEFICRIYSLDAHEGASGPPMIALHLERDSSVNNAISEIVAKYHLTEREQEVLQGLSMGLATKELAERMNISPNTVKAFLRLVMIKMRVTTRAGIIAKILHNGSDSDAPESSR